MPQELRFTWWGGVVGAKLLSHVECTRCGHHYNGKTGGSNTVAITIYVIVVAVFAIGLVVTVRSGLGV